MKAFPDVDFCTKIRNHRKTVQKTPKKRKKQQPTENQKNTECQSIS